MSSHVTLLGAEDVQRAGRQIEAAADTIASAASRMDHSAERMSQALTQAAERIEAAAQDARDDKPTLRDYFAAKAMASFCAGATGMGDWPESAVREQFAAVSKFSYWMAEEMLKARQS